MLQGAADAAANIGPAMPAVVARFHLQMQRRFRDEGAGGPSGRWVALDPEYAAWKAKKFPGKGILEATGALRESLTSQGEGSVVSYGPNSVFIGSDVEYAEFHQTGTGRMPRRAPIAPSDREVAEWAVEVWRYFERQTSKVGWRGRFAAAMS
jgi:phage gpG-like protein